MALRGLGWRLHLTQPAPHLPSFSPRPESETGDTKVKLKLRPGSQARLQRGKEKERGRLLQPAHVAGSGVEGGKEELLFKFQ